MYKEIFKLVVAIISQPGKAWDILTRKEEKDDEFYPGLCILSSDSLRLLLF